MKILNAPARIWLQIGDDLPPDEIDFNDLSDVSWCEDRIDETDIEYVRADLVLKLKRGAALKDL